MNINIHSFIYSLGESCTKSTYFILAIAGLSFLVIAIPLFIYRRKIWRCIRRQNDPNNEREALNPENIGNGYAANHIIEGPRDLPENRIAVNRGENVDA